MDAADTADCADEAAFYDARWSDERFSTLSGRRLERAAAILAEMAALGVRDPDIVEIGCGAAVLTDILSHCGRVTATDIAHKTIERVQSLYPQCHFVAGSFF